MKPNPVLVGCLVTLLLFGGFFLIVVWQAAHTTSH
ncbi:MAG: hypothetical protein QOH47_446 [Sphingomonadales bacterium]|jgi:hypothetical protein|nr:hypothetical protein [Sphingomonadales bacterium]